MKNIVILGVARSGKTTLARMIKQEYSNYNIIDGDCIRTTFEKTIPQLNINHFGGAGMKEDFPKFCGKLFQYQIKEHKKYFGYIFEGCDIKPTQAKEYFNDENNMIIFLGYPKLTIKEVFNNYKKYAEDDDYMIKKTDEEILNRASMWLEKSKDIEIECKENNIKFLDVSYNRDELFKNIVKEINKYE